MHELSHKRFGVVLLLLLATLCPTFAFALQTVVQWEEPVYEADFIGILECVKSGYNTCDYRVVESWKGPGEGTVLRVNRSNSEPGQQWFVVLRMYRFEQFRLPLSPHALGHSPSLWPSPDGEWESEWQQAYPVTKEPIWFYRLDADNFHELETQVRGFLNRDDGGASPYLASKVRHDYMLFMQLAGEQDFSLLDRIAACNDARDAYTVLFDFVCDPARRLSRHGIDIPGSMPKPLVKIGLEVALQRSDVPKPMIESFQDRLPGQPVKTQHGNDEDPLLRELFERSLADRTLLDDDRWPQAFLNTSQHEPVLALVFLLSIDEGEILYEHKAVPYNLVSIFATHLPAESRGLLAELAHAPNSAVALAGVHHFAFHDPIRGKALLEEVAKRPGEAGAWATLGLVCHGHGEYMAAALDRYRDVFPLHDDWLHMGQDLAFPDLHDYSYLLNWTLNRWTRDAGLTEEPPPPWPLFRRGDHASCEERLAAMKQWWEDNGHALEPQRLWSRYDEE